MISKFARVYGLDAGEKGRLLCAPFLYSTIIAAVFAATAGLIIPASAGFDDVFAQRLPEPNTVAADPNYFLSNPFELTSSAHLKQSVFGFAGRTNSGNLGSTFAYGIGNPETIFFDNYIVGGAYQRDFIQFSNGLLIGAEVGIADRFGTYEICCDTVVRSNRVAHSAELWGGVSLRHEGLPLFDMLRISPGFVFGLSAISSPIGQEALHQIDHQGSAKVLFYLGFDLAFSLASSPNTELVFRIQHRSGGYGTLGGMKEGNNANVVGIRHRF